MPFNQFFYGCNPTPSTATGAATTSSRSQNIYDKELPPPPYHEHDPSSAASQPRPTMTLPFRLDSPLGVVATVTKDITAHLAAYGYPCYVSGETAEFLYGVKRKDSNWHNIEITLTAKAFDGEAIRRKLKATIPNFFLDPSTNQSPNASSVSLIYSINLNVDRIKQHALRINILPSVLFTHIPEEKLTSLSKTYGVPLVPIQLLLAWKVNNWTAHYNECKICRGATRDANACDESRCIGELLKVSVEQMIEPGDYFVHDWDFQRCSSSVPKFVDRYPYTKQDWAKIGFPTSSGR